MTPFEVGQVWIAAGWVAVTVFGIWFGAVLRRSAR